MVLCSAPWYWNTLFMSGTSETHSTYPRKMAILSTPSNMERHPAIPSPTAPSKRLNRNVGSIKNRSTASATPSTEPSPITMPVILSPKWSSSHLSKPVSSSSPMSVSLSAERERAL